jgi:hypothetical protein
MHPHASGRFVISVVLGAVAYYALLGLSYGLLQHSYQPSAWWMDRIHPERLGATSWFVLVNGAGAVLAAIPVVVVLQLWGGPQRRPLALMSAALAAATFVGGGVVQYGLPTYAAAWVVELAQLATIFLAVPALIALLPGRPLTTRSSGP